MEGSLAQWLPGIHKTTSNKRRLRDESPLDPDLNLTPLNQSPENQVGILVVGHGSRRQEANEDVREATRQIARRGPFACVEPAFLEIVSPTIA